MADLRRQILDASIDMVAEEGVRAMSFRAVARRAGVSHQAPYHHFGDYRGILLAIAREGFGQLSDTMRAAAERTPGGPVPQLRAVGLAYLRFVVEHPGHARVMFQRTLFGDIDDAVPEAEATKGVVGEFAAQVVAAGGGRGASAEALAELCWATVHGSAALAAEGLFGGPRRGDDGDDSDDGWRDSDGVADQQAHAERVVDALTALLAASTSGMATDFTAT